MGACLSSNPDELTQANKEIKTNMKQQMALERHERKLLLLGTGSSGKSTLFKGLRLINGETFQESEQTDTRKVIRANLITGILTLLRKSTELYEFDPESFGDCKVDLENEHTISAIEMVVNYANETFQNEEEMEANQLRDLGSAVDKLWKLDAVKNCFAKRGGRFSFPDNLDFYFNKVESIMEPDYLPDDQDLLKARVRTTGMIEMVYERGENTFKIYDVGGQRNERKKWIHSFEHVSAVLFVAALNHYNAVLFEDEKKNAMHEAVELFNEICNSKWFRTSEMILLLNKQDLFDECLRNGAKLGVCFSEVMGWMGDQWTGPDYEPRENEEEDAEYYELCSNSAKQFIQDQFGKVNQDPNKGIYCHFTCATDTAIVEKVFWDVQNIVIRSNLKRGGLMM